MQKQKVLFIINPISGGINKNHIPELIYKTYQESAYDVIVEISKAKGHSIELAKKAVSENYDFVFSVGGDGTMNEVARNLINTKTALGLVPMGSGNGLARHLKLPLKITDAISILHNYKKITIDTGLLNDQAFINVAGVGFDALIGKVFSESKSRGFKTYITSTLKEILNYKSQDYTLINGSIINQKAFLISFANSSQYGNNAYIAPHADLQDGMIDVALLKPFSAFAFPELVFRLFNKSIDKSSHVKYFKTNHLKVQTQSNAIIHLDGDPYTVANEFEISVNPSSLNLIVQGN